MTGREGTGGFAIFLPGVARDEEVMFDDALVFGREASDARRPGGPIGPSVVKKEDLGLLGDGVGGNCARVSMVLSASDGLGRRLSGSSKFFWFWSNLALESSSSASSFSSCPARSRSTAPFPGGVVSSVVADDIVGCPTGFAGSDFGNMLR